jgi:hypothetical protein
MTSEGVFSGRLLGIWISVSVILLALSLYFMIRPQTTGPGIDDIGPGTFSRSALGHAGLAQMLERLGIRVVKSRYDSLRKLGDEDLLVIAEPEALGEVQRLIDVDRVLLVLPKREGIPSRAHPGWIADNFLRSEGEIQDVLLILDIDAAIAYTRKTPAWKQNELGVTPEIAAPVQLITAEGMWPVVGTDRGALVGEFQRGRHRLWILADPDVIENHGLTQGANAAFAVALINKLRGDSGSVVFDETVHGYGYVAPPASPLKLLFTFPYVLATAQGFLAIGLLLWATLGRFGKAEPVPPALDAGKRGLILNVAELLGFAGHHEVVVQRYVQEALRDAARQLHAPPALAEGKLISWLSRVGALRGVELDCAAIVGRMDEIRAKGAMRAKGSGEAVAVMSVARDIYRWRRGIIDGDPGDQIARGSHPRRDR